MQVIKTKKRIVLLWIGFASGSDKLLLKMGLIERKCSLCHRIERRRIFGLLQVKFRESTFGIR